MGIKLIFLFILSLKETYHFYCIAGSNGCATCSDPMTCSTCEANFWLPTPSSPICNTCSSIIAGCQACDSTSVTAVCTQCNAAFHYALINGDCVECLSPQIVSLTGDACQDCDVVFPGCRTCPVGSPRCSACKFYPLQYFFSAPNTCQLCDNSADQWLNNHGSGCDTCSSLHPNCETCSPRVSSGTDCQACTVPSQHYLDAGECSQCNYLTTDDWLKVDKSGCDLCGNVIDDCSACAAGNTGTICTQCSSSLFTSVDQDACSSCFSVIRGCKTCVQTNTGTQCSQCLISSQSYLGSATECIQCDNLNDEWLNLALDGCSICAQVHLACVFCARGFHQRGTLCYECDASRQYYLNGLSCVQCDYTNGQWLFIDDSGGKLPSYSCEPCEQIFQGCLQCQLGTSGTQCAVCDVANQYAMISPTQCRQCANQQNQWLNTNVDGCELCSVALPGCSKCRATDAGTACSPVCDLSAQQFSTPSGCSSCNNGAGFFLNEQGNGCATCENALLNCDKCEAGPYGTLCVGCNITQQEFIFPGNNFCTRCFNQRGFYVELDGVGCSFCQDAIPGCQTCYAAEQGTRCAQCQPNHPECLLDTCGDAVDGEEACDDGNVQSGDGCSSACQVETGWSCSRTPGLVSFCRKTCGDNELEQGETCDDGNQEAGDGCSQACTVEQGWVCIQLEKSYCDFQPICGNSILEFGSNEGCDDGNFINGDGCSNACIVEPEWVCSRSWRDLSKCMEITLCGNNYLDEGEACDHGNINDGDGCSSSCQIEIGWGCILTNAGNSACFQLPAESAETPEPEAPNLRSFSLCGNGQLDSPEQCDDGNEDNGDGCGDNCVIELNFFCEQVDSLSDCRKKGQCGNELRDSPQEQCDDGNLISGDGCDQNCQVEGDVGFCGNGVFEPDNLEECDDGDMISFNGCNTFCQISPEFTCQNEPLQKTVCSIGVENAGTTLPVNPCAHNYQPPARFLGEEEIPIYQEVLGEEGIITIGQAAILLYSNPQYQAPVYQRYLQKGIKSLWIRIQSNIFICQGLIVI